METPRMENVSYDLGGAHLAGAQSSLFEPLLFHLFFLPLRIALRSEEIFIFSFS